MGETARLVIAAIFAPGFLVLLQGWQHRGDRKANWAREDAVALQAAEAARLLLEQQQSTAALLVTNNESVATATSRTHRELGDIHTLVNASYTDALKAHLATLLELQGVRAEIRDLRGDSEAQRSAVVVTDDRIDELRAQIAERTPAGQ
jgi:hypothetical protein